jgi:mono/diheme cytochrome c family protein
VIRLHVIWSMTRSDRIGVVALSCAALVVCIAGAAQKPNEQPEEVKLIQSIRGPALFEAYCAVCHGKDGKGKGPMASSLKIVPADLTRIKARNRGTFPSRRLEKIISGEEQTQGHGTREMPVWGPIFSQIAWDQDLGRVRIDNLVRYLEQIQVK